MIIENSEKQSIILKGLENLVSIIRSSKEVGPHENIHPLNDIYQELWPVLK